jgi:hypothetical protein
MLLLRFIALSAADCVMVANGVIPDENKRNLRSDDGGLYTDRVPRRLAKQNTEPVSLPAWTRMVGKVTKLKLRESQQTSPSHYHPGIRSSYAY